MPPVPVLTPRKVVKVFENLGWAVVRQRRSHIIMTKNGHIATLSVPDHSTVARGTLRSLIAKAGISGNFEKVTCKVLCHGVKGLSRYYRDRISGVLPEGLLLENLAAPTPKAQLHNWAFIAKCYSQGHPANFGNI